MKTTSAAEATVAMMDLVTNVVRGANAERLLLLVHGMGADERDLEGLLPYLDPEGRFVAVMPRAPLPMPPGYAWWEPGGDDHFVASLDALDDLLEAACDEHDMHRFESIVAGFSQGASLMLSLGLRRSQRPRPTGVLALSGWLHPRDDVPIDWDAAGQTPVLLQHGTQDPLVPVDRARETARLLAEHAVPTVYLEYPMQHQVAVESIQDAHRWLTAVLAGERPAGAPPVPADGGPIPAVTTATFEDEVLKSELPVIVDFWAPWCGPCRMVAPIVEQIATMRKDSYKVVKVNIDEEPSLAQEYGVQSIPLIALFRDGRMERASLGAKPRPQLEAELGMLVIP
jgi:thioredoxin